MKTIILITLSLILMSCEGGAGGESVANPSPSNKTNQTEISGIDILDGTYKSSCINEGGDFFVYLAVISNYEIQISKTEGTNSNCEGIKSVIVAKYNVNGSVIDFVESERTYLSFSGGQDVCGLGNTSGDANNIDGVNCSYSFENLSHSIALDNSNGYIVNGVTVEKK